MESDDFAKLYESLTNLANASELKNLFLKINADLESEIIRIYGRSSALERAKFGLGELEELAYDTAEHHPYWKLLYDCSQILKIVLEKWNEDLTTEEINEIRWHANKISESLTNSSIKHHHE